MEDSTSVELNDRQVEDIFVAETSDSDDSDDDTEGIFVAETSVSGNSDEIKSRSADDNDGIVVAETSVSEESEDCEGSDDNKSKSAISIDSYELLTEREEYSNMEIYVPESEASSQSHFSDAENEHDLYVSASSSNSTADVLSDSEHNEERLNQTNSDADSIHAESSQTNTENDEIEEEFIDIDHVVANRGSSEANMSSIDECGNEDNQWENEDIPSSDHHVLVGDPQENDNQNLRERWDYDELSLQDELETPYISSDSKEQDNDDMATTNNLVSISNNHDQESNKKGSSPNKMDEGCSRLLQNSMSLDDDTNCKYIFATSEYFEAKLKISS